MKKTFLLTVLVALIATAAMANVYKVYDGIKNVTTAGVAVPLSATSIPYFSLLVCAKEQNTGTIAIGAYDVAALQNTRNGTYLNAGDCRFYSGPNGDNNGDLLYHYIDATVAGEGVTIEYVKQ